MNGNVMDDRVLRTENVARLTFDKMRNYRKAEYMGRCQWIFITHIFQDAQISNNEETLSLMVRINPILYYFLKILGF